MLLTGLLQGLNESLVHAQEIVATDRTMIIRNVPQSSSFTWDGRPWLQLMFLLVPQGLANEWGPGQGEAVSEQATQTRGCLEPHSPKGKASH